MGKPVFLSSFRNQKYHIQVGRGESATRYGNSMFLTDERTLSSVGFNFSNRLLAL